MDKEERQPLLLEGFAPSTIRVHEDPAKPNIWYIAPRVLVTVRFQERTGRAEEKVLLARVPCLGEWLRRHSENKQPLDYKVFDVIHHMEPADGAPEAIIYVE